jgi:hypothetical protein
MYEVWNNGVLEVTTDSLEIAKRFLSFYKGRSYIQYTAEGIREYCHAA